MPVDGVDDGYDTQVQVISALALEMYYYTVLDDTSMMFLYFVKLFRAWLLLVFGRARY